MSDTDETDGIFETGDVFANRELLRVGHVPDLERVVGRDEEVKAIGAALGPATVGGPSETTIIYRNSRQSASGSFGRLRLP